MSRPRIGVLPLARPTFDVPYAEATAAAASATLERLDADLLGPAALLFDPETTRAALADLRDRDLDLLLVLQVTFADAGMALAAADAISAPIAFWSFPEPRTGGRLRLNSLCGVNLAAHALGRAGRPYGYLHRAADDPAALDDIRAILDTPPGIRTSHARPANGAAPDAGADAAVAKLAQSRIGLVGQHPDGFTTCAYDPAALTALTGTEVAPFALDQVFAATKEQPATAVAEARETVAASLSGLDEMEPEPVDGTMRVYAALKSIAADQGIDGFAVRCWPEFFTESGCAACGAMSMLNQEMTPCGCEADVYGTLSTLALQALADEPVFMADLVDIDAEGDSGVFWHCGLAPLGMADPDFAPRATVHSNRKKPLLMEFPLKPGRITIARISQARNEPKMMLGGGEMLAAPPSFSGTSGVARFDRPAGAVLDTILAEGLEHHYVVAYGDHRPALRAMAASLDLPVLELC